MFDLTPDPILFHLGPIPVYWYGICYAVGLVVTYLVVSHEARRKGLDASLVGDGMIVIAVAALVGGRLYHVIDRWDIYQGDPISIVLPPYTGLGVFGGLVVGTLVGIWYVRRRGQSAWAWADAIAPGLFAMQAIGRLGNFFNQELYGPPTSLPWGIPIECQYRVAAYPCEAFPFDTTRFQPLFLYESLSGLIGMLVLLWLARNMAHRLRPGDLLGIFFIWYGVVRFALEGLRTGNWTFNGLPTAWVFAGAFIVAGLAILVLRHARPGPSIAEEDARRVSERAAADAEAPGDVASGDEASGDEASGDEASDDGERSDDGEEAAGPIDDADAIDESGMPIDEPSPDDEPSAPDRPDGLSRRGPDGVSTA